MANNLTYENINWGWLTDYNGYKFAPITFVEQLYTEDGKSFNKINTAKWNGLEDGSFVVKHAEKLVSIGNNNEINEINTKSYEPIYFKDGIPHLCDLTIVRNIYGNINCSEYSIENIDSEESFNSKQNNLYILRNGIYSKATEYKQDIKYYIKNNNYDTIINDILTNRENNTETNLEDILKNNTIINGGTINGGTINGDNIIGNTIKTSNDGTIITNGTVTSGTITGTLLSGALQHSIHVNGLSFNNAANIDVGIINSQYGGTGNNTGRILIGQKSGTTPGEGATSDGFETQALGAYSHAGGAGTIASGDYQTAIGRYNIADANAIFVVGNGTNDTTRSNALKIDAYSKLISNNNHIIRHSIDKGQIPDSTIGKALHFLGATELINSSNGEVIDTAAYRFGSISNRLEVFQENLRNVMYLTSYKPSGPIDGNGQESDESRLNASLYVYTTYDGYCEAGVTSSTSLQSDTTNTLAEGNIVFMGAAWNDYAEFRDQVIAVEPGYCVASTDDGKVYKTIERCQACDGIVSDTYGFAIGRSETYQTPLAVSGRVLAYCEGDRYDYHAGDTVCAGLEGKVCKMTREEIKEYPDRIIGIVSEIPEYEEWTGKKVNNRIWIKVK